MRGLHSEARQGTRLVVRASGVFCFGWLIAMEFEVQRSPCSSMLCNSYGHGRHGASWLGCEEPHGSVRSNCTGRG